MTAEAALGDAEQDALDAQWRQLGADPALMRPADDDVPDNEDDLNADIELLPDDWRAWQVFMACRRSWRVIVGFASAYYDGIDLPAVVAAAKLLGIKRKQWPDMLWRVSIMESEARVFLNKPTD